MSSVPSNLTRAPDALLSRLSMAQLNRTNVDLFRVQERLATGLAVNRPSDDIVATATISVLDQRLEQSAQRTRNLSNASTALATLDGAIADATDLANQARTIALAQVGSTSSAEERESQAAVVESLISSLFELSGRRSVVGHVFGGDQTGKAPVQEFKGGYRYLGRGDGLVTDIGLGGRVPVTLGGDNSIGETSRRHQGFVDLDPILTPDTRLEDLKGARGLGISPGGLIDVSFNGASIANVDVSGADTVADVADAIEASIRTYEAEQGIVVLGPGGVSLADGALSFDFPNAPPSIAPQTLAFADVGEGVSAKDLGLSDGNGMMFDPSQDTGMDLDPRLTWRTPITALAGVTGPLGQIRLNNVGQSRVVDLASATTLEDIRNAIEGADLGLRVQIDEKGAAINVVNEVATTRDGAMSIEEVAGGSLTATQLGIRTYAAQTRLSDFNDGQGVQVVSGVTDPNTGAIDPTKNVDFTVTLGDGREIAIDLRPEDVLTVQTLIDRVNAEAQAQGFSATEFSAGLSDDANGLVLSQDPAITGALSVAQSNNSPAFHQLGLGKGEYDPETSSFRAEDRARVRVLNTFTRLLDLRESLLQNDQDGIAFAEQGLDEDLTRLNLTRGVVGAHASRVESETVREEDRALLDERVRSELRDLDYSEAAVRFAQLQSQYQAALQALAAGQSRSLLDFLG